MVSVRERRTARIRSFMPFAAALAAYTLECHRGASFHTVNRAELQERWYATPIMRTRDSDALEESNWAVISERVSGEFPETVTVHSFGHWAYGWFERLYVRVDDALAIRAVERWVDSLAAYPIADEEHYAQTEWDHNHPSDTECHSQDPDCPCDVKSRTCSERFAAAVAAGCVGEDDTDWFCDLCLEDHDIDAGLRRVRAGVLARRDHDDKVRKGQLPLGV